MEPEAVGCDHFITVVQAVIEIKLVVDSVRAIEFF